MSTNPIAPIDAKHVILVGASKGGVGKSSCSLLLALALRQHGRVGWMDADVYGPSAQVLFELDSPECEVDGKQICPLELHDLQTMSLSYLNADPAQAAIWRGPLASRAITQIISETRWDHLDYLIIDLPPGTGDIPLSLLQTFPASGVVLVTTPSSVAVADVIKAASFFHHTKAPILGIIDNMSYLACDCGTKHYPFGKGGATQVAEKTQSPIIASLPLISDSASVQAMLQSPLLPIVEKGLPTLLQALKDNNAPLPQFQP